MKTTKDFIIYGFCFAMFFAGVLIGGFLLLERLGA